ncbi:MULTISPECIES: hypothetical protein [Bradyrhizobium]|jgi:hypothetical protein|uniref:hypothetical protein n=1 Tax=Bradyrhizobium TaxID=374 RepID=UPI0004886959|nr:MULTISPECIES: hypothetical protein [Bradyrhizobium]MCS3449556.1 hypothetical protein [Bradyrhizobium elkanii]MCS3559301.1 hypothetical protein [Bradyrhizobium elkanii]MCW2150853.1 hypothetical protein [Bradyrhizobium elkanii]MCW2359105.1 hypothetical protein [Bradyrhizobium elkanii]MCW2374584.1 hypothetical protein [Bradyrhizobium elkanii]
MGFFRRKETWERTFRLRSNHGASKGVLAVLFWLWGVVGLLFNAGTLFGLTGSVGVGTSAYLAATCMVWIGGMVLFGIGALLAHTDFDGERPSEGDYGDVRVTR